MEIPEGDAGVWENCFPSVSPCDRRRSLLCGVRDFLVGKNEFIHGVSSPRFYFSGNCTETLCPTDVQSCTGENTLPRAPRDCPGLRTPASSALSQPGPSSGTHTLSQPASVPYSCLVSELLEQKPRQHGEAENLQRGGERSEGRARQTHLLPCSDTCTSTTHCVGGHHKEKSRGHAQWPRRNNTVRKCMAWVPHWRKDPEDNEKPGDGERSYL